MSIVSSRYRPESAHSFLQQPTDGAPWREEALAQLKARGIPTPKLERWKYTNLLSFEKSAAAAAEKPELAANPVTLPWLIQNSRKLVFANGFLVFGDKRLALSGHNLTANFDTAPMDDFNDGMLWALNTAFTQDGPYLPLKENSVIEIMHLGQGQANAVFASPRTVIDIAPNTHATVIEHWLGMAGGHVHANHAVQITVGQGAKLTHVRIQNEADDRTVLSQTHVRLTHDAWYEAAFLNLGGGLSRQEYWVELIEQGADCKIKGAQLMNGRQHMDTTVLIEHRAPNCTSNQTIRNALAGESVGVFQGKIRVHQPAQKTDGYQLCNTLMLSPRANMNTKPELEIYADDVKCSHGTTTGCLDETPLFYLRSRGIPETEARRMMLTAFIGDLFSDLDKKIQEGLMKRVEEWLDHGLGDA